MKIVFHKKLFLELLIMNNSSHLYFAFLQEMLRLEEQALMEECMEAMLQDEIEAQDTDTDVISIINNA